MFNSRVSYSGIMRPSQGQDTGSIPVTRSAIKKNDFSGKFWRAELRSAQGFTAFPTASRFFRVRFEPKIFWREIFLEGRSFVFAISSSIKASFIHSRVGSIHADGRRKRRCIFSSTDFLSDIKERRLFK